MRIQAFCVVTHSSRVIYSWDLEATYRHHLQGFRNWSIQNPWQLITDGSLSSSATLRNNKQNRILNISAVETSDLESFDVLLIVQLSKWPTWRTIPLFYNTFITVLYMFRATSCSSSGGQIVLIQHLLWSLSVSGRPVHRLIFLSQAVHRTATYREWPY